MIDDVQQAAHDTVRNYNNGKERGAVALAPRVGMNPTTLSNKVNPNQETHHLGLIESIPIQLIAEDYRILRAYAHTLNHVVIPAVHITNVPDVELLTMYARFHKELGEMSGELARALEDRRITANELRNIRKEGLEAVTVFYELMARLEAVCER